MSFKEIMMADMLEMIIASMMELIRMHTGNLYFANNLDLTVC